MEEKELQAAAEQPNDEPITPEATEPETTPPDAAAEPVSKTAAEEPATDDAAVEDAESADAENMADTMGADELLGTTEQPADEDDSRRAELKAVLEAIVYVLNEPMPAAQIAQALDRELPEVEAMLKQLAEETARDDRGVFIREVAGGYQMATKPEHHDVIRQFVKNLKQPLKLSQAALETLAVIAYKQPITLPEILEIRGVQGGGVLKTLIDRKLVTTAGRKNVIGKPILYKTTKEFLTQFGLKDVQELPSLKEFEEIRRQSMADDELDALQQELPIVGEAGEPEEIQDPQEDAAAVPETEAAEPQAESVAEPEAGAAPDAETEQGSETPGEQPEETKPDNG